MSLFQHAILKNNLEGLNKDQIDQKYEQFLRYFGVAEIQDNIRQAKEEQFQEGFLRELFVAILGYTLYPNSNYNLTTEFKNISNNKKADGAIIKDEKVIGVIELKGTDTIDLDKVETQAFGYKNHQPYCIYVITSNFEKLRFYIKNAVNYIEFDLFKLSLEDFTILWLCLSKDNLLNGVPLIMKESSLIKEEVITKRLYSDYTIFREDLYNNIIKNNDKIDRLTLFKKTQKLIDRFLFLFFAEDRLLLPANSVIDINKKWVTLKEDFDEYIPLYDRFKKHFGYLNSGHKDNRYEIFAYNGGLFAPDKVLDNLLIDDEILHNHTSVLSKYDYDSEVDVNILGHIFEHSLGDIENVQAEIRGEKTDKKVSKRKKDGIFYTPKYITKHIVENTLGRLCIEKRSEFGIVEGDYAKGRKNRRKTAIKALDDKLNQYRNWLLNLAILDPACGSGAFLNESLDFLINEHRKIDELRHLLLGGSIVFSDITTNILDRNIYGVDLNEESVEIAKLSLWLRTAHVGRKLNNLNNNIKCGNSLINDTKIAGNKAFNWHLEFPTILNNGGFDVVIGNPPYVSANNMSYSDRVYFNNHSEYITLSGKWDLYIPFVEKGLSLLKENGYFSYIIPYGFLNQPFGISLRRHILDHYQLLSIVDLHCTKVFSSATVPSCITTVKKSNVCNNNVEILELKDGSIDQSYTIPIQKYRDSEQTMFRTEDISLYDNILSKIRNVQNGSTLGEIVFISTGAEIHGKESRTEKGELIHGTSKFDVLFDDYREGLKPYIEGSAIEKSNNGRYSYPMIEKYLNYQPNGMRSPKFTELFESNKIIIRGSSGALGILATFDDRNIYTPHKITIIISKSSLPISNKEYVENSMVDLKYILGILNSRLMYFYYKSVYSGFIDVYPNNLKSIVVPNLPINQQQDLIRLVENIILLKKEHTNKKNEFIALLCDNFNLSNLPKKIEQFYLYDFKELISEMAKIKIKMALTQQKEWRDLTLMYIKDIRYISSQISNIDSQIDEQVYKLYDLNDKQINIIKNFT